MNNLEILESSLLEINSDYNEDFNFISSNQQGNSYGLRANIVLTTLLLGSTVLAHANDYSNFEVYDDSTNESVKCTQKIGVDISNYVENINFINNYQTSKSSIIENILSFKILNNNWDGHSSIPLEVKSASNAILLLDYIGSDLFCTVKEIYPNPNGTITFEWYNENSEIVFLEVGNSTFSYYVSFNTIETKYYNKQIVNEENSKLLSEFIKAI
jgi:hypothetical protein